jgi:arylsulfatase A-like enzyme
VYTLNDRLDPSRDHVGKDLQKIGYQTAMIGKWHLESDPTGFDYWNILPGQGVYYDPTFIEPSGRKKYTGYVTDLIGDFSIGWLKNRDPKKPFFLMSHHKAPHRPWQPGPKYKDWLKDETVAEPDNLFDHYEGKPRAVAAVTMKVGEDMNQTDLKQPFPKDLHGDALRKWGYQLYIKDYLRCIRSVDDQVGRMLDYLESEHLADNTVIIYTSDQGFFLGDHGWFDKRLMYEESLRMPFLVRWPGKVKAGTVNDGMVLNVDFAPTLLDAAGQKVPADMQGRSFLPLLKGERPADWRTAMYYRYYHYPMHHRVQPHYGVRTGSHKLIYFNKINQWELYDLEKDPHELKNVYADPAYADTVKRLKAEMYRLKRELKDNDQFEKELPRDNVDAPPRPKAKT